MQSSKHPQRLSCQPETAMNSQGFAQKAQRCRPASVANPSFKPLGNHSCILPGPAPVPAPHSLHVPQRPHGHKEQKEGSQCCGLKQSPLYRAHSSTEQAQRGELGSPPRHKPQCVALPQVLGPCTHHEHGLLVDEGLLLCCQLVGIYGWNHGLGHHHGCGRQHTHLQNPTGEHFPQS